MRNLFKIIIILYFFTTNIFGQEVFKPNKFKIYVKNINQLKNIYKYDFSHIEVKKGEKIASIGAGDGSKEVQIAIMNEGIDWTLQEIDSVSLNPQSFKNVLESFEKIIQKPVNEKFSIVIGNLQKTNLLYDTYDRVLLLNVYHEITDRQRFMVENSGFYDPKPKSAEGGIGLDNLHKRLALQYGKKASFTIENENKMVKAVIKMPY